MIGAFAGAARANRSRTAGRLAWISDVVGCDGRGGVDNNQGMTPIASLFERHGLRHTPQREAVYLSLASTKSHPTAEELHAAVRRRMPEVGLATIYNTLDALERRGLCRRFADVRPAGAGGGGVGGGGGGGAARYDADMSDHVHVVLEDGVIRDVPPGEGAALLAALPAEVVEAIEARLGVRIDGVRLELRGRSVGSGRC